MFHDLDELVGQFSLYVLLWNAKVKPLPVIEWDLQVRQFIILAILICETVYSYEFSVLETKTMHLKEIKSCNKKL